MRCLVQPTSYHGLSHYDLLEKRNYLYVLIPAAKRLITLSNDAIDNTYKALIKIREDDLAEIENILLEVESACS